MSQRLSPPTLSIDDFPIYEQRYIVNSPRSCEACRLEGVLPEELLYIPIEKAFLPPNLEGAAKEYAFNKKEHKRLELIKLVKARRRLLIENSRELSKSISKTLERLPHKKPNKEKEIQARVLTAALAKEINRNAHFQAIIIENEFLEARKKEQERLKSLKDQQSMQERVEMERKRELTEKLRDKKQRKALYEKMKAARIKEEIEIKQQKQKEIERKKQMEEKEKKRKEIAEKAEALRKAKRDKFEEKLSHYRTSQLEGSRRSIELQRNTFLQQRSKERYETVRENVKEREEENERNRVKMYEELSNKLQKAQSTFMGQRAKRAETLRRTFETKIEKVKDARKAIFQKSNSQALEMLAKDYEKTTRVSETKEWKAQQLALKKQFLAADRDIKRENMERIKRKDQRFREELKQKLETENDKIAELTRKKEEYIKRKKQEQYQAEKKREKVRAALNYMAVWNAWDIGVIEKIVSDNADLGDPAKPIEEIMKRKSKAGRPGTSYDVLRKTLLTTTSKSRFKNVNEFTDLGTPFSATNSWAGTKGSVGAFY